MEAVKFDMKEMKENFSHEIAENKTLKESVTAKKAKFEKGHKVNESILDQETKDYIKNLELELLERNNLIKARENEIQKLQSEMVTKDKSLAKFGKINNILQNDVIELINLFKKLFPELKEMDSNLDNSSVVKMLEELIEEQQNKLKLAKEVENFKTELDNERENVKLREREIARLKDYITSYKISNSNNENTLKTLRENFKKEKESIKKLDK